MWLHPEIRTLPDIVRHWSARTPAAAALVAAHGTVSYAELQSLTNQVGQKLVSLGHQGENVCFIGKNVPEFWTVWLGAGKAASPIVPLNWRCALPELIELVEDARPAIIFVEGGLIAAYKVHKRIHIETALPMTTTGKVRKVELRALAARA